MAEIGGKTAVEADGNLDALLQQVFEERGYDFRDYKRASIVRRINKRLNENQLRVLQ